MKKILALLMVFTLNSIVHAESHKQNFSGIYDCTGVDAHEGNYKGVVTSSLNPTQSTEHFGAYHFKLDTENYGIYVGEAVAEGNQMAIHFALNKPNSKDYGTGIATFATDANGKICFHKYYYQREYQGGNHGTEDCIKRD